MAGPPTRSELEDVVQAHQAAHTPPWLSGVVIAAFYAALLVFHAQAAQALGIRSGRFTSVLACLPLFFVTVTLANLLAGMWLGPLLFNMCTGLGYRDNRMAYARAGGYDADHLTTLAVQVVLMVVYWRTLDPRSASPPFWRNVWVYSLATLVLGLALNAALDVVLFLRYARRSGSNASSPGGPGSSVAYLRGWLALVLGRHEAAIAAFEEVLRRDPGHRPSRRQLGALYYNAALQLARAGRYAEAVALNRRSIDYAPEYALAHNNLGVCLYALRQHREAVAAYHEALRLDPDSAPAHNNLAEVLVDLGDYESAAAACREALRLNPRLAEPHYHLGRARAGQGRWVDVVSEWEEALRLDPGFRPALENLASARARRDIERPGRPLG